MSPINFHTKSSNSVFDSFFFYCAINPQARFNIKWSTHKWACNLTVFRNTEHLRVSLLDCYVTHGALALGMTLILLLYTLAYGLRFTIHWLLLSHRWMRVCSLICLLFYLVLFCSRLIDRLYLHVTVNETELNDPPSHCPRLSNRTTNMRWQGKAMQLTLYVDWKQIKWTERAMQECGGKDDHVCCV